MKSWWSCRSAAASWPTRPAPSAPSSTGMLHLDGPRWPIAATRAGSNSCSRAAGSPWSGHWRGVRWGIGDAAARARAASAPLPEPPGSPERGFGTLKYEWRYIDEIDDAVMRAKHAEQYRIDYNRIRAHEDIAWTAPGGASIWARQPHHPDISHHRNPKRIYAGQSRPVSSRRSQAAPPPATREELKLAVIDELSSSRENVVDDVGAVASRRVVLGSTATAGVVCQPEIWRRQRRTRSGCRAGTRTGD